MPRTTKPAKRRTSASSARKPSSGKRVVDNVADMLDTVRCADLFDLCEMLPDRSIDMILCDLPYGTTACSWDTVIPFAPMWAAFRRVIKPRGAIVLTASQPFTSLLVCSNLEMFRYEWVWEKTVATNPMLVSFQPSRKHENILVFYKHLGIFNPQMEVGIAYTDKARKSGLTALHENAGAKKAIVNTGSRFPSSVQRVSNSNNFNVHPTQKPVALFEYLIRTYTQPGDVVLDPCVGSGTTAVAARKTDRRYICGDSSPEYAAVAQQRLQNTDPFLPKLLPNGAKQMSLFEVAV